MRILIIDRHPLVGEALRGVLRQAFPSAQIKQSETFDAARAALDDQPVELIVADILGQGPDRFERLRDIVAVGSPARVVVFGEGDCAAYVRRVAEAGAHGYVSAASAPGLIEAIVSLVLAGGLYWPIAARAADAAITDDVDLRNGLSPRQVQVLAALQRARSNKMIAQDLNISVATVKLHVQAILRRTGAHNRSEIVALSKGWRRSA